MGKNKQFYVVEDDGQHIDEKTLKYSIYERGYAELIIDTAKVNLGGNEEAYAIMRGNINQFEPGSLFNQDPKYTRIDAIKAETSVPREIAQLRKKLFSNREKGFEYLESGRPGENGGLSNFRAALEFSKLRQDLPMIVTAVNDVGFQPGDYSQYRELDSHMGDLVAKIAKVFTKKVLQEDNALFFVWENDYKEEEKPLSRNEIPYRPGSELRLNNLISKLDGRFPSPYMRSIVYQQLMGTPGILRSQTELIGYRK